MKTLVAYHLCPRCFRATPAEAEEQFCPNDGSSQKGVFPNFVGRALQMLFTTEVEKRTALPRRKFLHSLGLPTLRPINNAI